MHLKHIFSLSLLMGIVITAGAQQPSFDYDDYFYYRNHLYLGTSSIRLNGAGIKLAGGDTSAALQLVYEAAKTGMYDTGFISGRKSLAFITKTAHWQKITGIIENNRKRFGDPATRK
jgi:hypothetical protein